MQNKKIFFLDTETTGKDPTRAKVVEIAIHYHEDNNWWSFEDRCKPDQPIEIGAMAIHHITPAMVDTCPSFAETYSAKWINENKDNSIAIAHNAPYDLAILRNEGIEVKNSIDTLRVAKHVLQDENPESYTLQYLRYHYNLDQYNENNELPATMAHSALYDTICLKWLFIFLYGKIKKVHPHLDTLETMQRLSKQEIIMKTIPFGKYVGKSFVWIAENDMGYIYWLYNSEAKKSDHEKNTDLVATCNYYLNSNRKLGNIGTITF